MEQTNRIRAVFGAGFAVLLGVGMAAVVQTFVWENSVTLVARTYETLTRLDGIAYSSQAVESSALRYASTSDTSAAAECRQNLTDMRALLAAVGNMSTEGPSLQNAKIHLWIKHIAKIGQENKINHRTHIKFAMRATAVSVCTRSDDTAKRVGLWESH